MNSIIDALSGKKTYIIAFLGAGIALAQQFGFDVPAWALPILAFLGLGTLRAGVEKSAEG